MNSSNLSHVEIRENLTMVSVSIFTSYYPNAFKNPFCIRSLVLFVLVYLHRILHEVVSWHSGSFKTELLFHFKPMKDRCISFMWAGKADSQSSTKSHLMETSDQVRPEWQSLNWRSPVLCLEPALREATLLMHVISSHTFLWSFCCWTF